MISVRSEISTDYKSRYVESNGSLVGESTKYFN